MLHHVKQGTQKYTLEIIRADILIGWIPFLLTTNRAEALNGRLLKANLMRWIKRAMIVQWLEQWTGDPEVAGLNPTCCYINAIGKEGTG